MKLTIVIDNPKSWFIPFEKELYDRLQRFGEVVMVPSAADIQSGNEIAFLLSCESKVSKDVLDRSRHNIVVHASDLPKGRGMSPLTWQILEGKAVIPVSLFEAVEAFDAGPVYLKDSFILQGNELLDEMRDLLGAKIIDMCQHFMERYPAILTEAKPQEGIATFYPRRKPNDSRLDPNRTIAEQFNLLRVVDNEKYPAFFEWHGRRFVLKISVTA